MSSSDVLMRYKTIREFGRAFWGNAMNLKIPGLDMTYVMSRSGSLLGMKKGGTFVFADEADMSFLNDFMFHEFRVKGESAVERYNKHEVWKNDIEKEMLQAHLKSRASLFRVESVDSQNYSCYFQDMLTERSPFPVVDVGFSQTAFPGVLVFSRIISYHDLNMTGGAAMLYPQESEAYLRKEFPRRARRVDLKENSACQYIAFYKLYHEMGLGVRHEELDQRV